MTSDSSLRISLWSGPRNVSTALMYSFAQRQDTRVYDEPLYAHYLSHTEARKYHPGAEKILRSKDNSGERVIRNLFLSNSEKPVLFFKNMAHHLVDLDWGFLSKLTNVLLTREPRDMLISYSKTIPEFGLDDVGYLKLNELSNCILKEGQVPIVLDSQILLKNPERILRKLCDRLGLPFKSAMLSWEAGPRPEDGIWAPYWYHGIHRSSRFQPYAPKTEETLPEMLEPLLKECLELYDLLRPYILQ
ncbi:MAG: sulfotransferase family protein [Verrucomicrobia bacterium]|nr:sulfotransferase family protein [Verrucomicrobiota bacterium]